MIATALEHPGFDLHISDEARLQLDAAPARIRNWVQVRLHDACRTAERLAPAVDATTAHRVPFTLMVNGNTMAYDVDPFERRVTLLRIQVAEDRRPLELVAQRRLS